MADLKKTPLYDYYQENGYKLTDFGGWALPVQYTKIQEEHEATRNAATIFDVAHMGEIFITGEKAEEWLNGIVSNDISKCEVDQAQYLAYLNDEGGVLDDGIIFRLGENEFLATPNAANTQKIWDVLEKHNENDEVKLEDRTDEYAIIALQGPKSDEILSKLTDADLKSIEYYHFVQGAEVAGRETLLIGRNGYTGEDGFEIYIKQDDMVHIWKELLRVGEEHGLIQAGLGARDTLRLEAGLNLYGNDLKEEWNALETGIGFAVKTDKETEFPGQKALQAIKEQGKTEYFSRGFEITGKGIARQGTKVYDKDGEVELGEVTSGTKSPSFGKALGMALLKREESAVGTEVTFDLRGKKVPGVIVKKDWLRRDK